MALFGLSKMSDLRSAKWANEYTPYLTRVLAGTTRAIRKL
jgi:hypothetical protein